jgi:hypothetical protein
LLGAQALGQRVGDVPAQLRVVGGAQCGAIYQVRQVCREMNMPWPLGFEQLTPLVADVQLNILCRQVLP